MITDIPKVKISGITYPIYALDYEWGGADAPSKVTISFTNKNGVYEKPKKKTDQVIQIKCGDFFKFDGYPVTTTEKRSNSGSTMTVTFVDTSIILDSIQVVLKGLHGPPPPPIGDVSLDGTSVSGVFDYQSLAFVGKYVDPCESITESYEDPCHPCQTVTEVESLKDQNEKKRIDCNTARFLSILDVNYTFLDLIGALQSKGITFYNIPVIKNTYYARYTGKARDVLRSWCNDLGFTFVWKRDGVWFIDLKKGININDSDFYVDCSLEEITETETIEDNYAQGNIFYFGAEGEIREYDCSAAGQNTFKLALLPITLTDLFRGPDGKLVSYIKKYYTKNQNTGIEGIQLACLFAKHSRMMRDMVLMYEFYDVNIVSQAVDKDMPLLGMKIKQAWDVANTPSTDFDNKAQQIFWNYIPESVRARASELGASVCIIEYNEEWYNKFYDIEKRLAEEFIGQNWISFFSSGQKYTFSAPDGTAQYFDAGTPVTLKFADLVPESVVNLSLILNQIIDTTAQRNKSSTHIGDVSTDTPNTYANSFVLMNRSADWAPTTISEEISKFEKNYNSLYFYSIEPFKEEGSADLLKKNEFYALIFNKPGTFNLVDNGTGEHPTEKINKNLIVETDNYQTNYGLRSAECHAYTLQLSVVGNAQNPGWVQQISFYMPVQSHDSSGGNFPGYTVLANKNSITDAKTKVFIPRREVIVGDMTKRNSQSVGLILNFKDLSSTIQSILTESGSSCGYNVSQITSLINEFKIASSRPAEILKVNKEYSINGFPTRELSVSDGLSGLSIRYDGNDGIKTSISFSNSPPIKKSENVIDQEVERNIFKRLLKRKFLTSEDKIQL